MGQRLAISPEWPLWSAASESCPVWSVSSFLTFFRAKVALRSENVRPWHEVEHDFNECEYRSVRERQMKELELDDDLLSKIPVRCADYFHHFIDNPHRDASEICAPNCTKSPLNLSANKEYNA